MLLVLPVRNQGAPLHDYAVPSPEELTVTYSDRIWEPEAVTRGFYSDGAEHIFPLFNTVDATYRSSTGREENNHIILNYNDLKHPCDSSFLYAYMSFQNGV